MDEKTLKALAAAGAIRRVRIIADGARFHVEAVTQAGPVTASTLRGAVKTWATLDSTAKWVRSLGIGRIDLDLIGWQPGQRGLQL